MLLFALVLVLSFSPNLHAKTLVLLTTSDLQGQMEPATVNGESLGGFARIAWVIKLAKTLLPQNTIAVATGDDLLGEYFLTFKGRAIYSVLSEMGIDVATLGNHEFDQGPEVLAEAMEYAGFPFVETNLSATALSPFKAPFLPCTAFERDGLRIGFIGLITPDLPHITRVENSVQVNPNLAEVATTYAMFLKEFVGVDVVVALTHIGLEADKELAQKVPEIDVICGAHSHDMLMEAVEVPHENGRKTVIVQTGLRGRYFGVLLLQIEDHRITRYRWVPVKMDSRIPEDQETARLVESYRSQLPPAQVLTHTEVPLDSRGESMRTRETNLGDMVTDVIRQRFGVDAVILNGGGFRGDRLIPAGPITTQDTATLFPFGNSVVILRLKGKVLKEALERGASALPQPAGRFLQVSGMRVVIDPTRQPQRLKETNGEVTGIETSGERVIRVEVATDNGYLPLDMDRTYTVATNTYLASGGDGYFMLKEKAVSKKDTYVSLKSVVEDWLASRDSIAPATDGRITVLSTR